MIQNSITHREGGDWTEQGWGRSREGGAAAWRLQACEEKGRLQAPLGQAPQGSIISAGNKGAGVENPIVGPRMEISLIYSLRLPQAFCPRLFV